MPKRDRRTLTNQPDPPDYGTAVPKRIRTQIHRRTKSTEPLSDQWDAGTGCPPTDLRTPPDKMISQPRKNRKTHP
jgi:hypothetical protein